MNESRKDKLIRALERIAEVQEELIDEKQTRIEELEAEIIELRRQLVAAPYKSSWPYSETQWPQVTYVSDTFSQYVRDELANEQEKEKGQSSSSER